MPTHYLTPQGRVEVAAVIKSRVWRFRLWRVATAITLATLVFNMSALGAIFRPTAAQASNPSANLDQCANDPAPSPSTDGCSTSASDWVNGNLGASKSVYYEGDTIPYRMRFDNLSTSGSHTVTIEWDTTKSSTHAIDYVTTYNRTVATANPTLGVSSPGSPMTFAIPADPQVTGAGVTPVAGNFTMWGGTITSVSTYSYPDGSGFTGDKSAQIAITFTATNDHPTLAWGGHISTRSDWGANNAAVAIPGSPYHTRLIDLDGKGGNQDRSLSAEAVVFPGSVTIVKQATPEGSQSFGFTASPSPLANFSLIDDGTTANTKLFSNIIDFKTYAVSESVPSGWTLNGIACTVTSPNGGSQTVNNPSVSINLKEGENVSCTYTNSRQAATLTVVKHVVNDNGGTAVASNFTMNVTGTNVSDASFPGAENPGTTVTLDAGSYSVSETGPVGYSATYSADCSGTIAYGQSKTCTITNNDVQPKLTVTKVVVNNNGGTKVVSDFPLFVNSTSVTSGVQNGFNAGSYTVSETNLPGYTSAIGGDCASNGSITLNPGDVKSCTITNDDQAASLTVIKHVVNDNGGTAVAGSFTMNVTGTNVSDSSFPGNEGGTTVTLNAGSYSVDETAFTGYAKSLGANCSGTIANGESKTCTITNNDIQPKLTVTKVVVNDNGGTKQVSDFPLFVDQTQVTSGSENGFNAGSYTVSETEQFGYTSAISGDCASNGSITLNPGDVKSCTITNNDIAPRLTVIKHVAEGPGATASADDFTLNVDGTNVSDPSFAGDESGTTVTLDEGSYDVTESAFTGYTASYSQDCTGSISVGETKTCTVTNTRDLGRIAGTKFDDLNGDGIWDQGEPGVSGVTIHLSDGSSTVTASDGTYSFENVPTGTYDVNEDVPSGWTATTPNPVNGVTVVKNQTTTVNFGNFELVSVQACKIVDADGNLTTTDDQSPVPDWTVNLSVNGQTSDTRTTGRDGCFSWTDLEPGVSYDVSEVVPGTWTALTATTHDFGLAQSGSEYSYTFANFEKGSISGTKFDDVNGNGQFDIGTDTPIEGWTIYLTRPDQSVDSTTTGSDGSYSFTNLGPGSYTVSEDLTLIGWVQTYPPQPGTYLVTMTSGMVGTGYDFGNFHVPQLTVIKHVVNDNGGNAVAADFTMNVTGTDVSDPSFQGDESGTTVTLGYGSYSVDEDGLPGYEKTLSEGCSGFAESGTVATCTITNDDVAPTLTLIKTVITDDGGNAVVSDFPLFVNGSPVTSGSANTLLANTLYTATETNLPGYTPSAWGGDCAADGTITLNEGDQKTCTITNDDQPATLIVYKNVINDNGGNANGNDFTLLLDGQASNWGFGYSVPSNTAISIDEVGAPGYQFVEIAGDGCPAQLGGTVTLDEGQTITCTIWNDDVAPTITLNKIVINDNGGNADENDFGLTIGGTAVDSDEELAVDANTPIALNEDGLAGYSFVSLTGDEGCPSDLGGTVTLNEGEKLTCTITNDDIAPSLTLVKTVVNDNGGTASADDWTLTATGPTTISGQTPVASGSDFSAGTYVLSEEGPSGYTASAWDCDGGILNGNELTLGLGDSATCTITNDDQAPSLTLVKHVTNDNGGTASADDWTLTATGPTPISDDGFVESGPTFTAGTYTLSEEGLSGYAAGDWICEGGSQEGNHISLKNGESATCEITNDDIQPKLTVTKVIVNDNGGTKQVSDFPLFVDQTQVTSGAQNGFNAGTYTVSETGDAGYTATFSGDCNAEGQVTLGLNDVKSCTITNDDIFPDLTVSKTDNQTTTTPGATYSYTLTYANEGNRATADVTVVDTLPAHLTYVSDTSGVTPTVVGQVLTWVMPGLGIGASNSFAVTVKVDDVMPFGATVLHNVVSVSTSTPEFNTENNSASDDTSVSAAPTLGLQKSADPTVAAAGGNVTWTVSWSVAGNSAATNVTIVDPIPANSTFVSVADGGVYDATTNVITWNLGTQAPGASGAVHFVTKVASPIANGTVITNTATIDSAETDPAISASASVSVTSAPVLTLTKVHDKTTFVNPGATVTYTVTIKNTGTDAAKDVTLTDTLPSGFTFTDTGLTTRTINVGTLNVGATFTVSYTVTVGNNVGNGFYDNLATVTSSNHPTLTAKAPIEVRVPQVLGAQTEPILKIVKSVEPKVTTPGKTVKYTVTVTNVGDGTAVNVRLEDFLPAGLSFEGSGAVSRTWALGNLEPGQSKKITYNVVVDKTILPGTYENLATASADNHDKVTAEAPLQVRKPRVLGAVLPETGMGASALAVGAAALSALLLGLFLLGRNRRREEEPNV